jgi:hypothetical protein
MARPLLLGGAMKKIVQRPLRLAAHTIRPLVLDDRDRDRVAGGQRISKISVVVACQSDEISCTC